MNDGDPVARLLAVAAFASSLGQLAVVLRDRRRRRGHLMPWALSRLLCRLAGHRWPRHYRDYPYQVCTRPACQGRADAVRDVTDPSLSAKPWRPWARRRRLSAAQLCASVHTRWWWVPGVARRHRHCADGL